MVMYNSSKEMTFFLERNDTLLNFFLHLFSNLNDGGVFRVDQTLAHPP